MLTLVGFRRRDYAADKQLLAGPWADDAGARRSKATPAEGQGPGDSGGKSPAAPSEEQSASHHWLLEGNRRALSG